MTAAPPLPRHLILAGAALSGMLLALAIHILGQRLGLDLGGLWQSGDPGVPANAALAWWLMAIAGFASGHLAATLMDRAASGRISRRMRHLLIGLGLVVLAAAGQAAAAPSAAPSLAGVLAGVTALCLGALMAFCGAYFALGRA